MTHERIGDPLVILPGLLCDSRMFASQINALDAAVIDGFYGGADRMEAMAAYAIERMPPRAALLGHSMGARVALEIWRRAPGRVSRLALVDTGVHAVRQGEAVGRYALRDRGRAEGNDALVDAWLLPMIGPAHRNDVALVATLHAMCVDAGVATFERQIEALLARPNAEELLSTIDCPTFVIVGGDDTWAPVEQHAEIAAQIAGAQLRIVADAGHMLPAEEPERFNQVVREWLDWPNS